MSEAGSTTKQKEEAQAYLNKQKEEIGKYAEAVQKELQGKERIEAKLKAMEERVLHGGENMVEKVSELKKLAKETKADLDVARCVTYTVGSLIIESLWTKKRVP